MEEHFLKDFVVGVKRETPRPWYNGAGDCIIYQITDEAVVADRIDEILTIYRSLETEAPVGYQIKGVKALANKFGWDGVLVQSKKKGEELEEVSLSALLLSAYEQGPKTIGRRRGYADALESAGKTPRMQASDLEPLLKSAA
jgi:hypothetical protein